MTHTELNRIQPLLPLPRDPLEQNPGVVTLHSAQRVSQKYAVIIVVMIISNRMHFPTGNTFMVQLEMFSLIIMLYEKVIERLQQPTLGMWHSPCRTRWEESVCPLLAAPASLSGW